MNPANAMIRAAIVTFLGVLLAANGVAQAPPVGSVSGVARFEGAVPDREFRDNEGNARPLLQVNKDGQGLASVVAYLEPLENKTPPPSRTTATNRSPVHIQQEDFEFVPRVVALRPGQKVAIGSSDLANHNVHSLAKNPENAFNVMTPYDKAYQRNIHPEPDGRPIRLTCDLHPWMTAWIYTFEHDHFAVSDDQGRFTIQRVRPGRYRLILEQPDGPLNAQAELVVHEREIIRVSVTFNEENLGNRQPGKIEVSRK
ncbi:MAG: hypothetical protein HY706_00980 [Candidatus Hydrogenedentes bacterium]|nr:hypothetical protein [Candidatus Hydrogenedentota bacterium]